MKEGCTCNLVGSTLQNKRNQPQDHKSEVGLFALLTLSKIIILAISVVAVFHRVALLSVFPIQKKDSSNCCTKTEY